MWRRFPFVLLIKQNYKELKITKKDGILKMTNELLKYVRKLIGLTQSELAEKVKVNQSTIAKIEAGKLSINEEIETKLKKVFDEEGISKTKIDLLKIIFDVNQDSSGKKE